MLKIEQEGIKDMKMNHYMKIYQHQLKKYY